MDNILQVLQWDAALTGVDLANKLKTLMLVAFQDNVQPLACAATIAIGDSITCSGELIGEGRDALNPKGKVVELKSFGVSLGLLPKGTASTLSESPGGVKAFLLISGLRMWLKEASLIGDVFYQIALQQGIQNQMPVSASTLADVTDVLLAYTPRLTEAASEHLKYMDSQIYRLCGPSRVPRKIYHVESPESLARLLNSVFRHYMNQEARYVVLKGSVSAMWIITLLTWLLPDDVCTVFKNQVIWGRADAKITIELPEFGQESTQWIIQSWTASAIEDIIPFGDSQPAQHVPWRITRQCIRAEHEFSDEILSILGQLSGYLVKAFIEVGQIQDGTYFRTNLDELISKEATSKYESIMKEFGWDDRPDSDLYAALEERSLEFKGLVSESRTLEYVGRFRKVIKSCIYKAHPKFIENLGTDLPKQEDILNLAVIIATSALGSLMVGKSKVEHGVGYSPCIHFATYRERERMVELLMSVDGIEYRRFRSSIYSCILSCMETGESMDTVLVVEQDGLLLYPKIILGGKVEKTSAFNLVIQPGAIRTESSQRYKFIRETLKRDYQSSGVPSEPACVKAFSGSEYIGLKPKTDWMAQPPELLTYTSIQGDSILVRPTLRVFPKDTISRTTTSRLGALNLFTSRQFSQRPNSPIDSIEVRFRYLDVLENLATALLVPKSIAFSIRAESSLAKKCRQVLDQTAWLHPASSTRSKPISGISDTEWRFIVCTENNLALTLFQLSIGTKSGRTVIMEKGCNLMQAVHAAEEARKRSWVIIVGGL